MVELRTEKLNISISAKGAELRSLFHVTEQREYLWQGDPEYWSKSSPVLFPIVGAFRENIYTNNGSTYHLNKHGFARDTDFQIIEASLNSATFLLKSDEKTFHSYPFNFQLYIQYKVESNKLTCRYKVQNTGVNSMYFSLGAHPAFKLDFRNAKKWNNYYLIFQSDEKLTRYFLKDNLITEDYEVVYLEKGKLPLYETMFNEDAWVMKDLKSSSVTLTDQNDDYKVGMTFNNFPYFGLWSAKGSDFICLEPWFGVNDNLLTSTNLNEKEGIQKLSAQADWNCEWSILLGNI